MIENVKAAEQDGKVVKHTIVKQKPMLLSRMGLPEGFAQSVLEDLSSAGGAIGVRSTLRLERKKAKHSS